jgi:Transposase DDE domain group 1
VRFRYSHQQLIGLGEAAMANLTGESESDALRLDFDRRLMLQFRGSVVTSDAGLLAYREHDDTLGLTVMASDLLADARTGKNGRHALAGLFRQSVFGRLTGYEDVNDVERLRHDPAMRWIVGGKAAQRCAASPSQMGRFETQCLAAAENLSALADLSGHWIDRVHARRPPRGIAVIGSAVHLCRQLKLQERIPADPCAAPKGSLPIRCVCARWLRPPQCRTLRPR